MIKNIYNACAKYGFIFGIALLGVGGIIKWLPHLAPSPLPSMTQRLSLLKNPATLHIMAITLLTAMASLGLYTFITSLFKNVTIATNVQDTTPFFWVWGVGGMIGSFGVGHLIDKTKQPKIVLTLILLTLSVSLLFIPSSLVHNHLMMLYLCFFVWGMMGWSSLAPQQHSLFALHPQQGGVAVALNSSFNYLGGALGTFLGGLLLHYGMSADTLPYFAAGICFIAFLLSLGRVRN